MKRAHSSYLVAVVIIAVTGGVALLGDEGREALRFGPMTENLTQPWRFLTGHIVHLGLAHWAANAVGLGLIFLLWGRYVSAREWLLFFLVSAVAISLVFWCLERPDLRYVGLSGVLHGAIVLGLWREWRVHPGAASLVAGGVAAKLLWEHLFGALPGSEAAIGGGVLVNAHLYGALTGAVWGALTSCSGQAPPSGNQQAGQ